MKARVLVGILALTGVARAADETPFSASSVEVPIRDVAITQPVLPPNLFRTSKNFWVVGIGVERFASRSDTAFSLDHFLVGVSAMWRLGPFAPHGLLMMHPSTEHENLRLLGGFGFRGYFTIPGFTEVSAGLGAHLEARLQDHFWLGYLTPIELGAVVYKNRTFEIEAFLGVRRVIAGHLINHFLIDPNGFDNDAAGDALDREKNGDAWKGFLRVVFARRFE